eukprot:2661281-Ditylum_brightwellii.AAC.1
MDLPLFDDPYAFLCEFDTDEITPDVYLADIYQSHIGTNIDLNDNEHAPKPSDWKLPKDPK